MGIGSGHNVKTLLEFQLKRLRRHVKRRLRTKQNEMQTLKVVWQMEKLVIHPCNRLKKGMTDLDWNFPGEKSQFFATPKTKTQNT